MEARMIDPRTREGRKASKQSKKLLDFLEKTTELRLNYSTAKLFWYALSVALSLKRLNLLYSLIASSFHSGNKVTNTYLSL